MTRVPKEELKIKTFKFPGGETQVAIDFKKVDPYTQRFELSVDGKTFANDPFQLALIVNALRKEMYSRRLFTLALDLDCPYFPYQQQDRVCNPGEALSVQVMAEFINSLKFDSVRVLTPHSDVLPALLPNINTDYWSYLPLDLKDVPSTDRVLVCPDAGAEKRVMALAISQKLPIIKCYKHRDTITGQITETTVDLNGVNPKGKHLIIVDDVCVGGRTFVEIAKALDKVTGENKPASLTLSVTHGIFSNGFEELFQHFTQIYTSNSWNRDLKSEGKLIVKKAFKE